MWFSVFNGDNWFHGAKSLSLANADIFKWCSLRKSWASFIVILWSGFYRSKIWMNHKCNSRVWLESIHTFNRQFALNNLRLFPKSNSHNRHKMVVSVWNIKGLNLWAKFPNRVQMQWKPKHHWHLAGFHTSSFTFYVITIISFPSIFQ